MITLDVVDFQKEMKRIEAEVSQLALKDIHSKIDYAEAQLQIVTPVDTGVARKGWYTKKSRTLFNGQVGEINNDVEYISFLNNGHSKQAPKYFIEQVLVRVDLI